MSCELRTKVTLIKIFLIISLFLPRKVSKSKSEISKAGKATSESTGTFRLTVLQWNDEEYSGL